MALQYVIDDDKNTMIASWGMGGVEKANILTKSTFFALEVC